ncbi:MAG: phage portal protein [Clostridia bacterium]|jgi:SPP1 family phage portal protein|nr:phage portal protein [Clostridia bacterium]MCI2014054.1 phage portal protein [Clostridia bacterium]
MYLTQADIINAKLSLAGQMNESDIIKYILTEDSISLQKKHMSEGERYYVGEHDTLQKDYRTSRISETQADADGSETETVKTFSNPNRSNHHNVNAFHRILVDQKTSFIVGREPTLSVEGAEENKELKTYEDLIAKFADENFNETLQDWVTGASNKGFEALHVYYDDMGNLQYCIVPAEEIIPVYDTNYQRELEQLIRYYEITVIKSGQKYRRRKVEWWTKQDVTYYTEREPNIFIKDTDIPNPSPHFWDISLVNGMEKKRVPHSWGKVPFIILKNNRNSTTDLQPIKGLIDAYDMISSEGTNNFLDLVDLYWVIQGYGGETAGAIAKKLQINKAVNISDSSGSVEAKQVELPVSGRIEYLKMLNRDIYKFGMGVDIENDTFGNAPSGVSLRFHYQLLREKAESMAAKLKKAIKEFFWFITDDYNRHNGTAYDSGSIDVTLNYSQPMNDVETVNMINQSKGIVSDKTLLAHHPFVDDVNAELKELDAQEKENMEKYSTYQQMNKQNNQPDKGNEPKKDDAE